jgi:hypothetical protein
LLVAGSGHQKQFGEINATLVLERALSQGDR